MAFAKQHIILEIDETARNQTKKVYSSYFNSGNNYIKTFLVLRKIKKQSICCFTIVFSVLIQFCSNENLCAQNPIRKEISLDQNWRSIEDDHNKNAFDGFDDPSFNDKTWSRVEVPNNWDAYAGYRRLLHGNRHGYAWYRKKFSIRSTRNGKHF